MNTMTELETQLLQALKESSKGSEEQVGQLLEVVNSLAGQVSTLTKQVKSLEARIRDQEYLESLYGKVSRDFEMVKKACDLLQRSL